MTLDIVSQLFGGKAFRAPPLVGEWTLLSLSKENVLTRPIGGEAGKIQTANLWPKRAIMRKGDGKAQIKSCLLLLLLLLLVLQKEAQSAVPKQEVKQKRPGKNTGNRRRAFLPFVHAVLPTQRSGRIFV